MFHVLRNGSLRERLEIEQTGVAPPFCVAGLDAELALYLVETLGIDIRLHGVPDGQEMARLVDAVVVLMAEFVPERTAVLHLVVPRHVVEPGEQVLRTGIDVVVELAECLRILLDIGGTRRGAVEAHTDSVGLVVVGWGPVGTHALGSVPRLWSVMVGAGKDVVNAQRHHVVDACLAAVQHQLEKR